MSSPSSSWREGFWCNREAALFVFTINGENIEMKNIACIDHPGTRPMIKGKITSGDFGPTSKSIFDATGVDTYNLQWENITYNTKTPAVLNRKGTRIHMYSWIPGKIEVLEWIDDNELHALKGEGEPIDAPRIPSYINPNPENMGKIIWFCGPPGSGKSTSAQLMGRHHGYVYYEADCFTNYVNPFIDISVPNPTLAWMSQKSLKGHTSELIESTQVVAETIDGIVKGNFEGLKELDEKFESACAGMIDHIKQQRRRLGGNWAIAWALMSRTHREKIRKMLGPEVIFFVLSMTQGCVRKRLIARHGKETVNDGVAHRLEKMHSLYEEAGSDEINSYNVHVDENTSENSVIEKVMEILAKH